MKNFYKKLVCYLISLIALCVLIFVGVIQLLPAQFDQTYQAALNEKYEYLLSASSPKVIFISGSSGGIGINSMLAERELGVPFVNLALHASFGMKLETEMAKANLNSGDLVILAYEYDNWKNVSVFDPELVMTAFDQKLSMYRYISPEHYWRILQYFPKFMLTKLDSILFQPYTVNTGWIYCRDAFDKKGNVVFPRPNSELPAPVEGDGIWDKLSLDFREIDPAAIEYVNQFIEYAEKQGAKVAVSFPGILKERIDENEISSYESYLQEHLNAPVISKITDYLFEPELIYDTSYHLTDEGTRLRTEQLVQDIRNCLMYEEAYTQKGGAR